jgi:hypothetical protein
VVVVVVKAVAATPVGRMDLLLYVFVAFIDKTKLMKIPTFLIFI